MVVEVLVGVVVLVVKAFSVVVAILVVVAGAVWVIAVANDG